MCAGIFRVLNNILSSTYTSLHILSSTYTSLYILRRPYPSLDVLSRTYTSLAILIHPYPLLHFLNSTYTSLHILSSTYTCLAVLIQRRKLGCIYQSMGLVKNGPVTQETLSAMENLRVHIRKGCLSNIPPGCGWNRTK